MPSYDKNSFAGCDITAVFGNTIAGELQAISYSTQREVGPVYTMGSADPRSFAKGKRAHAGTLIFITLDRNSFLRTMSGDNSKFYAKKNDIRPGTSTAKSASTFDSTLSRVSGNAFETTLANAGSEIVSAPVEAWYVDQIPPFTVNLSAANERGDVMKKSFTGVQIMNEGGGVSVDDLVIERTIHLCLYSHYSLGKCGIKLQLP